MQPDQSRAALAEFLRTRRQRITPDQVGLPAGPRRRIAGLRREEIAVLTGISPTWYTYLEQGRDIRPSNEVLDNLARVLQLNEDERVYLYLLVNGQRPPPRAETPDTAEGGIMRRIVALLGDIELPMVGCTPHMDITCWNEVTVHWFTDFGAMPPEKRNLLWWQLTDPAAKERIVDWAQDSRDLVARLRIANADRPWDDRFTYLVDRLQSSSPEFREWWVEHDVYEQHRRRVHRLRHPNGEIRETELVVLRSVDSFNSLMLRVPALGPVLAPDRLFEDRGPVETG